jgi:Na+-translocating ferredoxin:NAD+ oxidoreductase RnfD subunit
VFNKKFFKTPKGYLILILLAIAIVVSIISRDYKGLLNVIICILTAVAIDLLFAYFSKKKNKTPDGAIITGLIIGMILTTVAPVLDCILTSGVAILSKHLIHKKNRPLFNPAAFGLLFSAVVLKTGQSWWGSFSTVHIVFSILLLIVGYLIVDRIHKFQQVFAFLGFYFILLVIFGVLNVSFSYDLLREPYSGSALFLSLFMLTDIPTSPAKPKEQWIFGVATAVLCVVSYQLFGGLTYLLIGLLIANLLQASSIIKKVA